MDQIKVIRIEHSSNGEGFFTYFYYHMWENERKGLEEIERRHIHTNGFPGPDTDQELQDQIIGHNIRLEDYNFAYCSLEQMKAGFTSEEIKLCIDLGFQVLMYTLDKNYYKSKYQVIFSKKDAIEVQDITSLFL